ncbi:hypothetical protein H696_04702 [Fonticula alba]|uniref:DNA-directed RNA polymerase n=1 Tax=Fonticula alba TaxID=691883 RepID=A0A058Z4G6_FONAL|nr:hypothetical protein H696_04702 [Fonticula alba]KCV68407.1 hypothetical protein H696_04702 [Fonticula alba]|eukprot:XP_009496839.1 hypothetical protein H696_04702 [Fonticula alba]
MLHIFRNAGQSPGTALVARLAADYRPLVASRLVLRAQSSGASPAHVPHPFYASTGFDSAGPTSHDAYNQMLSEARMLGSHSNKDHHHFHHQQATATAAANSSPFPAAAYAPLSVNDEPIAMGDGLQFDRNSERTLENMSINAEETLAMMDACLRTGMMVRAFFLFNRLRSMQYEFTPRIFHSMIEAHVERGGIANAFDVIHLMRHTNVEPTPATFVNLAKAAFAAEPGAVEDYLHRLFATMFDCQLPVRGFWESSRFSEEESRQIQAAYESFAACSDMVTDTRHIREYPGIGGSGLFDDLDVLSSDLGPAFGGGDKQPMPDFQRLSHRVVASGPGGGSMDRSSAGMDLSPGSSSSSSLPADSLGNNEWLGAESSQSNDPLLERIRLSEFSTPSIEQMRRNLRPVLDTMHSAERRQEQVEMMSAMLARHDRRHENALPRSQQLDTIMAGWRAALVPALEREIQSIREGEGASAGAASESHVPFLSLLKPELTVDTLLNEFISHYGAGPSLGMRSTHLMLAIGSALESTYNGLKLKRHRAHLNLSDQRIRQILGSSRMFNTSLRRLMSSHEHNLRSNFGNWRPVWPGVVRARVGSVLLHLLLSNAYIDVPVTRPDGSTVFETVPAWYHTYAFVAGRRVGVIRPHAQLSEILSQAKALNTLLPGRLLPMLVPPRPWLTYNSGGYLTQDRPCMRIRGSRLQFQMLRAASYAGQLTEVLAALDVLGQTRWRINTRVLDVASAVWNNGGGVAAIPDRKDIPLPEMPADMTSLSAMMRRQLTADTRQAIKINRERHALRCSTNYTLEVARAYASGPLYFPHTLDFRGRAYPVPPHLNHLGNDLNRGLLLFDEARPLGERGLFWLKVHLSNVLGHDKIAFSERVEIVDGMRDRLIATAADPLKHTWWQDTEDPWQVLATTIEYANAMALDRPEEYECRLPVHQDGSCNGLQHYAALGGDVAGAMSVNLVGSDTPQDVYLAVANVVEDLIRKDLEDPSTPANLREIASMMSGRVSRKVVKQTVMTNVYGVTFIGARLQIENRLREESMVPERDFYRVSWYLTRKVFDSLQQMFQGAREIQNWLSDAAEEVSRSRMREQVLRTVMDRHEETLRGVAGSGPLLNQLRPADGTSEVIWTTPLGLPIVQPYRKGGLRTIRTTIQTVQVMDPGAQALVNVRRQRAAFPPNFIHSLDSTHMLMTALSCARDLEKPIQFASVHDSYWTHPSDVDALNHVIRDQFVKLHSQPIMENLRSELLSRYSSHIVHSSYPPAHVRNAVRAFGDHDEEASVAASGFGGAVGSEMSVVGDSDLMMEGELGPDEDDLVDPSASGAMTSDEAGGSLSEEGRTQAGVSGKSSDPSNQLWNFHAGVDVSSVLAPGEADLAQVLSVHPVRTLADSFARIPHPLYSASEVEDAQRLERHADFRAMNTMRQAQRRERSRRSREVVRDLPLHDNMVVSDLDLDLSRVNNVLVTSVLSNYRKLYIRPVPDRGTFDVSAVRDSQYFFA